MVAGAAAHHGGRPAAAGEPACVLDVLLDPGIVGLAQLGVADPPLENAHRETETHLGIGVAE
jgi:hypothetical protein